MPAVSMDLSASAGRLAPTRFLALWSVFLVVVCFSGLDGRLIRAKYLVTRVENMLNRFTLLAK